MFYIKLFNNNFRASGSTFQPMGAFLGPLGGFLTWGSRPTVPTVGFKAQFDKKLIEVYICQVCVQERYSPLIT